MNTEKNVVKVNLKYELVFAWFVSIKMFIATNSYHTCPSRGYNIIIVVMVYGKVGPRGPRSPQIGKVIPYRTI